MQAAITTDFILLPCDIVCELDGLSLLQAWMVNEAGFGDALGGLTSDGEPIPMGMGGEKLARRGGLGVWYTAKQGENSVKGEQTDFLATTPLTKPLVPPPKASLRKDLERVVLSMPTDSVNDIVQERKSLPIRHALLRNCSRVKMRNAMRDAHIYLLPYWVKDMAAKNTRFESASEDLIGWWAKAGWQEGLGDKLGLREVLQSQAYSESGLNGLANSTSQLDEEVDVGSYCTTRASVSANHRQKPIGFASRVRDIAGKSGAVQPIDPLVIPQILAYVQPSSEAPKTLIRRVDTPELLRHVSLLLARQPSIAEGSRSAFAHQAKITHPESIPAKCRVEAESSLLDANVSVAERVNVKQCVIGASCTISEGARLQGCVLMEGCTVGDNVQLTDCILGPRCRIDGGARTDDDKTVLRNCEVQASFVVPWGSKCFRSSLCS